MTRHRARRHSRSRSSAAAPLPCPTASGPRASAPPASPRRAFQSPRRDCPIRQRASSRPRQAPRSCRRTRPLRASPRAGLPPPAATLGGTGLLEEAAAATQSGRFDRRNFPIFGKAPATRWRRQGCRTAGHRQASRGEAEHGQADHGQARPAEPDRPAGARARAGGRARARAQAAPGPPLPRRRAGAPPHRRPRPAFVWPEGLARRGPDPDPRADHRAAPVQDRIELPKTEAAPQARTM